VPARLLRHVVNRGLPAARNTALAHARAERCFVLDSDNAVLPHGLARLAEALDADPGAAFAYGMLAMFDQDGAHGLRSRHPWAPRRLRHANPIDAMALIRTAVARELGGWTTDERLHGWEDYDLWCAVAERGGHGAFVPEIVARYRVSDASMSASLSDLSTASAYAALIERHPRLMAGVVPPR
jgi:glycosyltransferase involved in cell wall biosynthesis